MSKDVLTPASVFWRFEQVNEMTCIDSKIGASLYEFQIKCGDRALHIRTLRRRMKDHSDNDSGRATDLPSGAGRAITIADNSFDTRDIFVGTREVTITHGGERYRLRLTAQNKLILTK